MQTFVVFSAVLACAFARPNVLLDIPATLTHVAPLAYAKLVPGAPIGLDGRVVDTPEVTLAKAEHAAAHINQKIDLAKETIKSADQHHVIAYGAPAAAVVATEAQLVQPVALATKLVPGAPIGLDGRVVDTPEVAFAKAEHAAAHVNERLGHQAAKLTSSHELLPVVVSAYATPVIHSYVH
ncbi:PREDICTED: cuticle protein 18.7-like [Dinoponera quadriceps]|uniref:Cuticle protein 18.7-like n=1 Tax=Dinoponera quadriceps TaxID=609295 RepID=A0A6P3XLY3_DINQU|nr:PREDICTED: cuticle protein 18.7-like [Dinoponera quadriceps]XP_014479471.1 PREDICTED: cuticle protein 18.7-like [Dinoponera quadriceps]XP_014479472.1 PREDICTED: cuticle protein 18.7-like [Dinoponera quadriceps]XP_014479473.1 PREDICTED: cuticle protein 18.7-like [Dinoponera quadriceps]XP_014479474.1 PREDICTED: cuticle protein 18.7-like [Dinoponera quadriceps]XP_014479475.1 PREDICTED: cuticle protein 18.7-like [Dinoponera quadriceps]